MTRRSLLASPTHLRRGAPLLAALLALAGCTGVINPPIPTATPLPTPTRLPTPVPPTATPIPEAWVKNHRVAELWSGPTTDRNAVSFGETSNTFCVFRVERSVEDARIMVYNPYTGGLLWIEADAVGPVEPPARRRGLKPAGQNCAEYLYDEERPSGG